MDVRAGGRLDAMSVDECVQLLHDHHFGRLAVVVRDQPLMFPVNYAMSGRQVVFRTDPGSKRHAASGRRVAFEIDGINPLYHDGWSVLVIGTAREETDPVRLAAFGALPLTPWMGGEKSHWMCIRGGAISGRRVTHFAE